MESLAPTEEKNTGGCLQCAVISRKRYLAEGAGKEGTSNEAPGKWVGRLAESRPITTWAEIGTVSSRKGPGLSSRKGCGASVSLTGKGKLNKGRGIF